MKILVEILCKSEVLSLMGGWTIALFLYSLTADMLRQDKSLIFILFCDF